MPGKLFIVSTPIGNLEDITLRALSTLKRVDLIACEDTRHTRKLLNHYGINTPTTSYHEHNENSKSEKLIAEIKNGKDIALVSDAGTPCISDPGFKLTKLAADNSIDIISIPGPSAFLSAVTLSGLSTDSFIFLGFVPRTQKKTIEFFEEVKQYKSALIFYESPKRILKSLKCAREVLGDRNATLSREITKIHEEVIRGKITKLIEVLSKKNIIRGEFTVVIEGNKLDRNKTKSNDLNYIDKRLKSLKEMEISLKDAVKVVSKDLNYPKKKVYQKALLIWSN